MNVYEVKYGNSLRDIIVANDIAQVAKNFKTSTSIVLLHSDVKCLEDAAKSPKDTDPQ